MRTLATGNKGFTLIEILVVVVIISVLATMTIPQMYAGNSASKLRSSARQLLVAAQYARDFAATRRAKCRLTIDPQQQQYTLTFQQAPGKFVPINTSLGKVQRLSKGLRFRRVWIQPRPTLGQTEQTTKKRDYLTFDPDGQTDAAALEITNGKQTFSIVIAPYTAYAKIIEGTVSELPNDRKDLDLDI